MRNERVKPSNTLKDERKIRHVRRKWMVIGWYPAKGYAKLQKIATKDKAYAALLNHRDYDFRLSYRIFLRARPAAEWRKKVFDRLERLKAVENET